LAPTRTENFEVRLAENDNEVEAAQLLRYKIFYEEMGARPSARVQHTRRDEDSFDYCCDHLLVIDRSRSAGLPFVVGTYRLMRKGAALSNGGFYSSQEYDLTSLIALPEDIVELGRSCVHKDYRRGAVMPLLWRGIADYIRARKIKFLFGCASFPGTTDPGQLMAELSYLYHYHLAPATFRPRAVGERYVAMNGVDKSGIDAGTIVNRLPPLVKGYMRLGAFVGDGAVIDYDFNTVDVCVVLKTNRLAAKYQRHYKPSGTP
jgi:putative hemolysin